MMEGRPPAAAAGAIPAAAGEIPAAGALRGWLRRARRRHSPRTWRDTASDAYLLFWVFIVYGWVFVEAVRDYLGGAGVALGSAAERGWLGVFWLVAGAGLVWRGLRSFGPIVVGGAAQSWCVASPVDRGRWLWRELSGAVGATVAAMALVALPVALVGTQESVGWALLTALVWGVALAGWAVSVQPGRSRRARSAVLARWLGPSLLGVGAAGASVVVGAAAGGVVLPEPTGAPLRAFALGGIPLAAVALRSAFSSLRRLDRSALGQGASLLGATATATVALDVSLLRRVIELRRWRRIGWVRSRRFTAIPHGRLGVLLQAEVRRVGRRPTSLATWAGATLVQAAIGVAMPQLAAATLWVGAYAVGLSFSSGLSQVSGSPALRRSLGGRNSVLVGAHLVLPTLASVTWWAANAWTGAAVPFAAIPLLLAGVVVAVYRGSTRPPLRYDDPVAETPFGAALPTGLILQLLRGVDALGAVMVAQFLLQ